MRHLCLVVYKLYHLEQSQLRDQFSINESGELTNHIDLEVETARDGIAWTLLNLMLNLIHTAAKLSPAFH